MSARRLCLSTFTALALGAGLAGSSLNAVARAATPAMVEDHVSLLATVEAIDLGARTVLLRSQVDIDDVQELAVSIEPSMRRVQ